MEKIRLRKTILLTIIILLGISFYEFSFVDSFSRFLILSSFTVIVLISFFGERHHLPKQFSFPLIFYFFGIFLSVIACKLYWDQSILQSFLALKSFYLMFFYFTLHVIRPTIKEIHRVVILISIGYVICYSISLITYPDILFGSKAISRRNTISINIFGVIFLVYSIFLTFYKSFIEKKRMYLFLFLIFLTFIFIRASRNAIFAILFLLIYFYYLRNRFSLLKFFQILLIVFAFIFSFGLYQNYFDTLVNITMSQFFEGNTYIRIQSLLYYLFEHSQNNVNLFFGNGIFNADSNYGKYVVNSLWKNKGFYAEDIGLIGFWSYFGVITLFSYIYMIFLMLKKHNSMPIRYFSLYLIIMSFATMDSYMTDSLIFQPLVFYMSDILLYRSKSII